MHEAPLAQAALPAPVMCLGLVMRPFSLGHLLCLIREGNPLASWTPGNLEPVSREALNGAALICHHSWREYRALPYEWTSGLKVWLWRWRCRHSDWEWELARWIAYRDQGSLELRLSDVIKPGATPIRMPGAPFLLRLHQFLTIILRLSEELAWDYPLGLAKMQWATYWEHEGALDVYNANDADFDAFVAAEEAKEAAKCQA